MNQWILVMSLALWGAFGANPVQGAVSIGSRTLVQGELTVEVWYPTVSSGGKAEMSQFGVFGDSFYRNAPLDLSTRRSLVLLSHGNRSSRGSMLWLVRGLVDSGYIVAACDHLGSHFESTTMEGSFQMWKRPKQVRDALELVLSTAPFKTGVRSDSIAVAGFSLGGYTALALVGAKLDGKQFISACRSKRWGRDCDFALASAEKAPSLEKLLDGSTASQRDPRFKAAVALAPAGRPGMVEKSLKGVSTPTLIIAARNDQLLPFKDYAQFFADKITGAKLVALPKGGHLAFLGKCRAAAAKFAPQICQEPPGGRSPLHQTIQGHVVKFLREHL